MGAGCPEDSREGLFALCDRLSRMPLMTIPPRRASVHAWHSPGSVVAPGWALRGRREPAGKPTPAAGETAHVRRLLVDRSRCGLEVSPARTGDTGFSRERRRAVVAMEGREPLSRRMWGRRPGRPGECPPVTHR